MSQLRSYTNPEFNKAVESIKVDGEWIPLSVISTLKVYALLLWCKFTVFLLGSEEDNER